LLSCDSCVPLFERTADRPLQTGSRRLDRGSSLLLPWVEAGALGCNLNRRRVSNPPRTWSQTLQRLTPRFIPTLLVPLMLNTHSLAFRILLQGRREAATKESRPLDAVPAEG